MNSPTVPTVTKTSNSRSNRGLWAICIGSVGSAVLLIGIVVSLSGLGYSNTKPQQSTMSPPSYQYYVTQTCWTAYDTNNHRVLYLHNNGYWYDFPPQVRQYTY